MSDESVRAFLLEQLDLPESWVVIPEQRFPETIAKTTCILQHVRIERLAEAPIGHLRHEVILSVVDPHEDVAAAEDGLDESLVTLITSLDGHAAIGWIEATKTMHAERYAAWNLRLTVITTTPTPAAEPTPEPEETS